MNIGLEVEKTASSKLTNATGLCCKVPCGMSGGGVEVSKRPGSSYWVPGTPAGLSAVCPSTGPPSEGGASHPLLLSQKTALRGEGRWGGGAPAGRRSGWGS